MGKAPEIGFASQRQHSGFGQHTEDGPARGRVDAESLLSFPLRQRQSRRRQKIILNGRQEIGYQCVVPSHDSPPSAMDMPPMAGSGAQWRKRGRS
jgi:hypothetical protein